MKMFKLFTQVYAPSSSLIHAFSLISGTLNPSMFNLYIYDRRVHVIIHAFGVNEKRAKCIRFQRMADRYEFDGYSHIYTAYFRNIIWSNNTKTMMVDGSLLLIVPHLAITETVELTKKELNGKNGQNAVAFAYSTLSHTY